MTDRPRVLIIADDLTGAMDAAGPFAARGLPTWVAALPEDCDPSRFVRATVVSVNTESRHLSPDEAARRVTEAWQQVGGEGFDIVVKKVDSTLRGNPSRRRAGPCGEAKSSCTARRSPRPLLRKTRCRPP